LFRSIFVACLALGVQLASAQGPVSTGSAPPANARPVIAGKVELVEGDVRFLDKDRRVRRPALGSPLYAGDSIVTGNGGEVHLAMEDGAYIGVRSRTKMRIVEYRAEGRDDDSSVIALLQGSFRTVTGWIATLGNQNYLVRTPTATIAVRGTEHEPLVLPGGSKEGEPGTYDRVYVGETVMRTPQGEVSVRPNQAGFASRDGAAPPQVLDRIPAFFRPTRNEARFEGLHERIHPQLEQRREERRQSAERRRNEGKLQQEQRRNTRRQLTEDQKELLKERRAQTQRPHEAAKGVEPE
jgi:FecR protein